MSRVVPNVSVVVCTHNGGERLLRVVRNLLEVISRENAEVVVVDNASRDGSVAVLRTLALSDPRLRVVAEPRVGLASARTAGVNAATAEIVVFVDDDNHLRGPYLELALEVMAANPRAAAAGGFAEPLAGGPFPSWFASFAHYYGCGSQAERSGTMPPASFLRGAGLVIRRESWMRLQEVSNGLVLSDRKGRSLTTGGDAELCFALQLLGWDLVYDDRLFLHHELPAARLRRSYLIRLAYQNGRASAVHDAYVAALIGWRPRRWLHALIHEVVPPLERPASPLGLACALAWRAGRLREIAVLRGRYRALPPRLSNEIRATDGTGERP